VLTIWVAETNYPDVECCRCHWCGSGLIAAESLVVARFRVYWIVEVIAAREGENASEEQK
jgi:hypothetical protein